MSFACRQSHRHCPERCGIGGLRLRRRAAGGFTLLELLLATAIGAIVLLVINATFFAALRLHNATHDQIDADLVVQRTLGIVRKDLAGIMLPPPATAIANSNLSTTTSGTSTVPNKLTGPLMTEGDFGTNDLDGTAERITPDIYTDSGRIDGWTTFPETQKVSYYLAPASDGGPTKNLVRVVTRNLLSDVDLTTDDQTLLTGVVAAGISYFDGDNWVDTWDTTATNTLPVAIKFSLLLADRSGTLPRSDTPPITLVVPVVVKTTTTAQQEAQVQGATP